MGICCFSPCYPLKTYENILFNVNKQKAAQFLFHVLDLQCEVTLSEQLGVVDQGQSIQAAVGNEC